MRLHRAAPSGRPASRIAATLLCALAVTGCSSYDPAQLSDRKDLEAAGQALTATGAAKDVTLYLALETSAKPDRYDQAHPDTYGMAPNLEGLGDELGAICKGAFARFEQHSRDSNLDPRDAAFAKDHQLLLEARVTKWDAVFVKKNGWWYPNAFFLAWYFYFPVWVIADEVYGVQAVVDYRIRAVRSGRTIAEGQALVDSRSTKRNDAGEEVPAGPLLELDDLDRGIDLVGTYTPGDLSREQWQTHLQPILEPYARREVAKALAREVGAKLKQFRELDPRKRDALTAAVHAVVVGVGRSAQDSCEFASEDATSFASTLSGDAAAVESATSRLSLVSVLKDAQATRKAVLDALETAVARAQPEDAVVFYFAGRGVRSAEAGLAGLGLSCYDAERGAPGKAATGVITLAEVAKALQQSRSRRPVLVLDTSFAGGPRGTEDASASAPLDLHALLAPIARERGAVIAACSPPERAQVLRPARHGLLTHALTDGLAGGADAGEGVTWDGLRRHVERYVRPLSELTSSDGEGVQPVFVTPDPAGRALR